MTEDRRTFLKDMAGLTTSMATLGLAHAAAQPAEAITVRDKLWIWGHVEGSLNGRYGLPGNSRMTPAEGAFYLDVPNLAMVAYRDPKDSSKMLPDPASDDEYCISFRPLKQVAWSIVGGGGRFDPNGLQRLEHLTAKFPNITGAFMDDFFRTTIDGKRTGVLTPGELAYIQDHLTFGGRKLNLWMSVHSNDLDYDLTEYLKHIDVLLYWTWKAEGLDTLERDFARAEKMAPRAQKVLSCFMWDFGNSRPMPIEKMQKQCTIGLKWIREKRIGGVLFLANCISDLGLEAVEWTREWIRDVGDTKL